MAALKSSRGAGSITMTIHVHPHRAIPLPSSPSASSSSSSSASPSLSSSSSASVKKLQPQVQHPQNNEPERVRPGSCRDKDITNHGCDFRHCSMSHNMTASCMCTLSMLENPVEHVQMLLTVCFRTLRFRQASSETTAQLNPEAL